MTDTIILTTPTPAEQIENLTDTLLSKRAVESCEALETDIRSAEILAQTTFAIPGLAEQAAEAVTALQDISDIFMEHVEVIDRPAEALEAAKSFCSSVNRR